MGYQVLARKYRPQRFADVAGQDHVTRTLLNALAQERIAHGYIFSGHRGIGKTTIARILAMALNCRSIVGSPERPTHEPCLHCVSCREISSSSTAEAGEQATHSFDFIEIDAASNRGIDDVRSIRTQASVQPARDKYKIFLLDEAHQITEAAFNAILKTLEEPPEWTVFMMATTEPENIPQTIRSRCQHFSFHAVKFEDILTQLKSVAAAEQVTAEDAALALLAEAGDGSMRDALSIMDQAIASAPLEDGKPVLAAAQIRDLMGSVPNAIFERLLEAVSAGQSAELMQQLHVLLDAGHSPLSLARQLVRYLRNALMAKLGGEQTELLQTSTDERARSARTAALFTEEEITRNLQIVLRTFDDLNFRQEQRFHLELGLLKLVHAQRLLPLEEFLSTAAAAPSSSASGSSVQARSAAPVSRPASSPAPARASAPAPSASSAPLSPFGNSWASTPSTPPSGPSIKQSAAVAPVSQSIPASSEPARAPMPFLVGAAVPVEEIAESPAPIPEPEAAPEPVSAPVAASALSEAPSPGSPSLDSPSLDSPSLDSPSPGSPSVDALSTAIVQALAQAGHGSASQLLAGGNWALDGGNLRVEIPGLGKKMIGLTINAAAEKIIRAEMQRLGGPARFLAVPGEGVAAKTPISAVPLAGSIEEEALNHPLVQRAKDIFHAEVRSVVDLRKK